MVLVLAVTPQGGDKRQFIEKQAKDGMTPHREIEFKSKGGKNLQVSFSIFILYTQHKLFRTMILKK